MAATEVSVVFSFEDARHVVEEHASRLKPRGRELLGLLDAAGRVLAEEIHADRDFPPFPRATRDGYAVRATDVEATPVTLDVVGEVKAGAVTSPGSHVAKGQAVAIMTGAAVPEGADSVVMLEHTLRTGDQVRIERPVAASENIVAAGAEGKKGEQLLSTGTRLDYAGIALAAAVGRSRLVVHARPRVAVLSTGDEVIDIDLPPGPSQIRNSNSYSLAAQIQACGGEPVLVPIAPDEHARLRELVEEGLECDLLLIAGGVSMGKYDLVEQVLADLKAEFFFTGAQIQPGRPIVFGRVPERGQEKERYFFGLPGNPISTMVTFELFAKPIVEALAGMAARPVIFTHAKLKSAIQRKTGLKRFLPGLLSGEFEQSQVELLPWQGSGDMAAVARANCFVVVPSDRERIEAGEWMPVLLR
jgi:molybdopterin molybdotransferase